MPCRIVLCVIALAAATAAHAADLPAQSRLGAIFAEPAEAPPPRVYLPAYQSAAFPGPIIPYTNLPNPVWNRGGAYYGSSWSYYNPGPYYGGPYVPAFVRLPYVCGLYGYCD